MSRRILLTTNCEYGQANVVLALAYELAIRPGVKVAIASFPALESRVAQLQIQTQDEGYSSDISFHPLPGRNHAESCGMTVLDVLHGNGVREALNSLRHTASFLLPWSESEYMGQLRAIEVIVHDFEPELVVVESLFRAGQDVCKKLGLKFLVVTPNSSKDLVGFRQPWAAGFWKYPALSSGYPYPLPWSKLIPNMYINLQMILGIVSSSTLKEVDRIRKSYDGTAQPIRDVIFDPRVQYLCPSTPNLDFPLIIPENVVLCGPLVVPTAPIQLVEPELAEWLDQASTILVNLGSHVTSDNSAIIQFADAFRLLLSNHPTIQVLWKLQPEGDIQQTLDEYVENAPDFKGRIRVVHWLQVEPFGILKHPNVICSVNHGGANSFFEAVSAGVPQVILPVWYDTYDYAARVEWLGVGLWGSHRSAPKVEATELGQALLRVAGLSEEAIKFREKAKLLGESCRREYTGRVRAADEVLKLK